MSQQGARQQSARDLYYAATLVMLDGTYDNDTKALFDSTTGASGTTYNESLLLYINGFLGTSYTNLPEAQQKFAEFLGAYNFSSLGALGI